MASRNYGMAFDTPYNERLLSILEKYDRDRDTNGEPDIFSDRMEGGAWLGADGTVHTVNMRGVGHPHLGHPLLGSMVREMDGGKFSFGKALGSVAKGVGKVALPIATKVGTKLAEDALMGAMGAGVYSAGAMYRPAGMVSPFVHQPDPFSLVRSGTMATYPAYNAVEMRALNGGACCGMCASGGKFDFGKALGSVAKGVAKVGVPIATKVGTKLAEDALMGALGAGVHSGGKFSLGKTLGTVAKGVAKVGVPIATKVGTKLAEQALTNALAGAGKKPRGRPRKMVDGANSPMGASGGKFSLGKTLGSVAKGVAKVGVPIATKVGTKLAEQALTNALAGAGVGSGGVGLMKKPRGRPRSGGKFDIFDSIIKVGKKAGSPFEKSVGVNPFTMGFDLGKDVIAPALMGKGVRSGGAVDGRKKRAEIVKKVMKEQGLKMTDASKYVKAHGLY